MTEKTRRDVLTASAAETAAFASALATSAFTVQGVDVRGSPTTLAGTRPTSRLLNGRADSNRRSRERTLLITGGTSGLVRSVAEDAARQGAYIAFIGRREALDRHVRAGIRAADGQAELTNINVLDRAGLKRWIDAVAERRGGIDLASLNMGIAQQGAPIAETLDAHWDGLWRTTVSGLCFAIKDGVRHMLRRGGGSIVYSGSAFGHRGQPTLAAYNANKFAVHGFMRSLALKLGPSDLRINAVAPGGVRPLTLAATMCRRQTHRRISQTPMPSAASARRNRSAKPSWLTTDEASFVQGEVFAVDGAFRRLNKRRR